MLNLQAIGLSGANITFSGKAKSDMRNDGVLHGGDIANMDLSKVQLVTLSMCNSYSGSRGMTDSPWDLIKAFKMAGSKAILSPLWNVSDKATATLMVEFYKHFVTGHTLNESLEYAKTFVRNQKGCEDPIYWASFVLIDAIE